MLAESIILYTGIVGVAGYTILFVLVLVFSRRTATHFYIMDVAVTMIIHFFVNPSFHSLYVTTGNVDEFDTSYFLSLLNFVLFSGVLVVLVLLLLMDYYRWITKFKWTVISAHVLITILSTIFYFVLIDYPEYFLRTTVFWILMQFFVFVLLFLVHEDFKFLQKRKLIDDESFLRYTIIKTFLCMKVAAGIIFAVENIIEILHDTRPTFGSFALGLTQFDSIIFLIVLFKIDHRLRRNFVKLFRMFPCKRSEQAQSPEVVVHG